MTQRGATDRPDPDGSGGEPRIGVLQVVLAFNAGGGERAAIEITKRLSHRFRMMACCLDEPGTWAGEVTRLGVNLVSLGRRPGFHPSLAWRIRRLARRHRIDVLHCHQYSSFVYGALAALPDRRLRVIVTEQGRLTDAPPSPKRRAVNRLLARVPSRVFAVSQDLRMHLIGEGFQPDRVEVLHNSVEIGPEVSCADRYAARAALGISPEIHVIGTVARLDPVKDIGSLIRAVARVRQCRDAVLVIVGDGPERQSLEATAHQLQLGQRVHFTGHRDDARRVLAAFDTYVNCSVTEGTSLTIMEAMAAGLPVVATNVGGTPEIVLGGETGVLVTPRDSAALADALIRMAEQPQQARRLGAAGRRRAEETFSIDGMVERYARAYVAG